MQICASWAADSTEKAVQRECATLVLRLSTWLLDTQPCSPSCLAWCISGETDPWLWRRREYLTAPAPGGDILCEVADPDNVPQTTETAIDAVQAVPFWLQPPPDDLTAEAWQHFVGRTHMVGLSQAWRAGLRFVLGEPGIPSTGISSCDLAASLYAPWLASPLVPCIMWPYFGASPVWNGMLRAPVQP